jgi:hypothetical protein
VVAFIVFVYARSGKRAVTYRLPQPWTHEPILWAAVDEPLPVHHGESIPAFGGGASGRW